jgi:hypothetical protein
VPPIAEARKVVTVLLCDLAGFTLGRSERTPTTFAQPPALITIPVSARGGGETPEQQGAVATDDQPETPVVQDRRDRISNMGDERAGRPDR